MRVFSAMLTVAVHLFAFTAPSFLLSYHALQAQHVFSSMGDGVGTASLAWYHFNPYTLPIFGSHQVMLTLTLTLTRAPIFGLHQVVLTLQIILYEP